MKFKDLGGARHAMAGLWFRVLHRSLCSMLLLALEFQLATAFAQGSLTPPGAPAPTMKSLDQIESRTPIGSLPFVIAASGSYYLVTNLSGVAGTNGITITADSVSLDLNGFSLVGVPGSLNGIFITDGRSSVVIRNGIIRYWDRDGIDALGASGAHFMNLHLLSNGRGGLSGSFGSVVKSCSAVTNAQWGIFANIGSTVSDSTARNNGSDGFSISNDGSTIRDSASSANGGSGFFGSGGNIFVNCSAARNNAHGFTGGGNIYRECSATSNGTNGFNGGAVLEGCHSANNMGEGIVVSTGSTVRGNNCISNGDGTADGAGIHATGGVNRIEGNVVRSNKRGIKVDGTRNIIFGNTAGANTINYVIAATNQVGLIVTPPASAAISGDAGGSGLGTTNPWANFAQ
ncbi:MAG TPA: right-handed parallel beta-helix repeat-containing protein [Verrucomicrobiae bacterium]|nr:right-handed parallel beta-helix repeat-containing protein [Verrucomicrobiae bacterium]